MAEGVSEVVRLLAALRLWYAQAVGRPSPFACAVCGVPVVMWNGPVRGCSHANAPITANMSANLTGTGGMEDKG